MQKNEWNLKDLFENEKACEDFCLNIQQSCVDFNKNYEGKIANLDPKEFEKALKQYEILLQALAKIMTYAFLVFAKDTSKGAFLAKFEEKTKKSESTLLFFELEFCQLDEKRAHEFIKALPEYAFYLQNLLKDKKHKLSKQEEKIILLLSSVSSEAFSRLFDESVSRFKIPFEHKKLSEEEILSKLYDSDRKIRKKAAKNFSKVLKKNISLLTYIFNMIKTERKIMCELRGYKNAEEPRHISNQITQASVDALIETTEKNFNLVSQFYTKKKELLGLKKLKDYDRYAPIGKDLDISFEEAKKIVLASFKNFSPVFEDIAKKAFDGGWIDVFAKEHKRGGAFSHSSTKDTHPYVLLNYTNKRRDLFTLAHELGHTIHQKLSYEVSFLNEDTPLTTAETASVFAEMLVFDYIKDKLSKDELVALMASKIEDIFATLYRQINFTTFERRVHSFDGELSSEKMGEIWLEESKKMFGHSVILNDYYALWYAYIPHFIHSPFYCYAYAYAQLLVLALYGLYKSGKCANFKELYIKMLSSGGSKSPKELISSFGFDIEDKNFWDIGIKEVKKLVDDFVKIKA